MHDVGVRQMIANDRFEELRHAARRSPARSGREVRVEAPDVELRLCKPLDDPALERLAALAEESVPSGRLVMAFLDGRLVAALPLAGGCALRDPFVRTEHIVRLLQLRAEQLRPRSPRSGVFRLRRSHA